ncbi:hypothetical protein SAY86_018751 [Trapa natans]|uniref:Uncharacterized protein n=1 Tax=Trapa natans TaxID=22666 RepID=A0AAN7R3F4_TRANT|nr:hypothetical protein SAY86_018751 [Trapa natans]
MTDPYNESSSFPSPSKLDVFQFSLTGESGSFRLDVIAIPPEKPEYVLQSDAYFERFRRSERESAAASLSRSSSLRLCRSSREVVPLTGSFSSSQRSPSSKRKYRVLIGVTKFPSRMDMCEIKRRQSLQPPTPLFPVGGSNGEDVLIEMAVGEKSQNHSQWSLSTLPLRCRSRVVTVLARASLGCMS